MDVSLALIGLVGGVITALSPCILPVLPVIFLSGSGGGGRRPYAVVAGLVTSFSLLTLLGTLVLSVLPVPQATVRWAGLIALVLLGLGLIVPRFEAILEAPFARIPQRSVGADRNGYLLGLVLGTVYVPCAGPVLAAITVAGATGDIGVGTISLTAGFSAGTAATLLVFALAGRAVTERVKAFRRRQRAIRIASGVTVLALAGALTFDLTSAIPNYAEKLSRLVTVPPQHPSTAGAQLDQCVSDALYTGADQLTQCGPAPDLTAVTKWINTDVPVQPSALRGKVVLVDFWTFDCINCRHVIPHLEDWYAKYHDQGLEVISVHTPEYAFEHDLGSVAEKTGDYRIKYPVAVDNDYVNWSRWGVPAWPTTFLVDAAGTVRFVAVGEGDYGDTEKLIKELLAARGR